MKVSVIISVYKDVEALVLIINALKKQTYKNFEVVIVEDGNSAEMRDYIQTIENLELKHTTQEDKGVRKARSQNNGLLVAEGEYLIFMDGDCIPYSTFIEGHVYLSEKKTALSGRRMNIPIKMAQKVRQGTLDVSDIEQNIWQYSAFIFNKEVRFKQGIYINPKSFLYKVISKRDACTSILGCNFSCFKKDMIDMNGFDESYGETAIPDDMDWEWRFQVYGVKLKSCKHVANMFHLNHKIHDRGDATPFLKIMYEKCDNGKYICEQGLNTHHV